MKNKVSLFYLIPFIIILPFLFCCDIQDKSDSVQSEQELAQSYNNIFTVNNDNILKNNKIFNIKGIVYVPGYPGYLPWELETTASADIKTDLKNSIRNDLNNITLTGANTVRFWGAPQFCYEVIKEIGTLNILQTVWFDGEVPDLQNTTYKQQCKNYIIQVVDRIYTAYQGEYPPIIAFILGNELSETTILNTNSLHPNITQYSGKYIKADNINASEAFLAEMANFLKDYEWNEYQRQSLITYSNEIRTFSIIDTPFLDFRSHNAYSYAVPYYLSSPPVGSSTFTHFQGWIELLKNKYPDMPLLITETGLSTSPNATHVGAPDYGYGGNTKTEQAEGLYARLDDIRLAEKQMAGVVLHEYLDAWWKFGLADSYTIDPDDIEEWFGLVELTIDGDWYTTINKPAYDTIKTYWTQ